MKTVILMFVSILLMHCQIVYVKSPEYVESPEPVILVPPPPPPQAPCPPGPFHPKPIKPKPIKPAPQPVKDNDNNFGKRPDRPEFERPERKKPESQPLQHPVQRPEIAQKKTINNKQTSANNKEKPARPGR